MWDETSPDAPEVTLVLFLLITLGFLLLLTVLSGISADFCLQFVDEGGSVGKYGLSHVDNSP